MERQNLIIRRQKQKQRADTDFYADTMEREKTRKAFSDVNREKGVFINRFVYVDKIKKYRCLRSSRPIFFIK